MSNAFLLILPGELLHHIFDYLDVQTILLSLRCVCTQFYAIVQTYDRFKLNLVSMLKSDITIVSRLIRPETIIALTFPDDDKKSADKFELFFSSFDIRQFTRLRSLTLRQIGEQKLDRILQDITTVYPLVSLSIHSRESKNYKTLIILTTAIAQSSVQKLYWDNLDYVFRKLAWPIQYTLQHLTIRTCSYHAYSLILRRSPHLRTFAMKDCIMDNIDRMVLSRSARKCHSQLSSLTLSECLLPIDKLQFLLLLTPLLVQLKLISNRFAFDSAFDGSCWEQFIRTNLPRLYQFDFFFASYRRKAVTPRLDSIINSFRTSFWLDDKHWITTCDYVINSSKILLYTTPVRTADVEILLRWEVSSMNCVRLLERCWTNQMVYVTKEKITSLNIVNVDIGDEYSEYLADVLQGNTTLNTLYFCASQIGDKGAQYLADVLRSNTTLTTLDLSYNKIEGEGAQYLAQALQINTTTSTLVLQNTQIGSEGAQYFADALGNNKTLISLDLFNNGIGDEGTQHLADALRSNRTLTKLILAQNQIGIEGIKYLADVLQTNLALTTLGLSNNQIGAEGTKHLTDALQSNTALTTLLLAQNQIGNVGSQHLADMLRSNMILTTLDIADNQIGVEGVKHLADGLQSNTTLNTLNFVHNQIDDEGAEHLADALRQNKTLTILQIGIYNHIGDVEANHLIDALRKNTILTVRTIWHSRVGNDTIQCIQIARKYETDLES